MRRFLLDGTVLEEGDEGFQDLLTDAYREKVRPLCLCCQPPVPMYVADIGDQLVIKRMPLSGGKHDPACPSYEPPYELSGLGPLMGRAIKFDPTAGTASLKLDFSLSKRGAVARSDGSVASADSVRNETKKMSLRGLLHFLWHESGLTEWTAHWSGKRHWWQVYHHLSEAARLMEVRGEALADRLFIPEPFRTDDKAAIEQRRTQKLGVLFQVATGAKKLMVLIGEIKEFAEARNGRQVVIKHMPGFRLYLEEPAWRSLQRRFETELMLWQSTETSHLMAIMTIGGTPAGITTINEIALMAVTEQWLPIESAYEQLLVDRLGRLRSKSVKGLRFNLPRIHPLANAVLPEAMPLPCALYIVPPDAGDDFQAALGEMIDARPDLESWIWRVTEGEMPPLPA
ncbi:Conserved predicted protein (plasmid) [Neorhizobium galegae bv. officinalis bv. officinalis str. HAMBI 1141]|uniref:DUF1173 domain-containing protein n=1 Tax=Neorhizobium galegae bv. officinalis bv. officinalis str. HAMBI 1141 TaxID=1028801 RepID=A0A068TH44_NEOGA|nr:DUF1173 domain-containing protein [Neorhizobium galegae]CDN57708.1 Conserved predicted protein [Neorhizobium galegae bv. officinalis bv. officinalis str. HAMBI 1141]